MLMSMRGTPNKCKIFYAFILIRSVNRKNGRVNEGRLVVVVSVAFS